MPSELGFLRSVDAAAPQGAGRADVPGLSSGLRCRFERGPGCGTKSSYMRRIASFDSCDRPFAYRLAACDPLTGQPIRAERRSHARYERDRPGELIHLDVKKSGRIPDCGDGGPTAPKWAGPTRKSRWIGYDYVHAVIDDHSGLTHAAIFFAAHGVDRIERVITDACAYPKSTAVRQTVADLGEQQRFIRPPLPLDRRQDRVLQPHPASGMGRPPGVHQQHRTLPRTVTVADLPQHSTQTHRASRPAPDQPTVTNVMTEYI